MKRAIPIPTTARRSLTLVEVLAALAILGGAATALLSVQARSLETLRHAQRDVVAEQLARELIGDWRLHGADYRAAESGAFDGATGWSWSRRSEPAALGERAMALRVTLSIWLTDDLGKAAFERDFQWIVHDDKTS
jgi:Tfp pilus assembly protein PilV